MKINYKEFKGEFVKNCPCSPEAVSCGYYNMNLHTGCPFSCTYCILQAYLESKEPVFYTNTEQAREELKTTVKKLKNLRISTGELSDSLAYEEENSYSEKIIELLVEFPEVVFEFKTKSANVENLVKREAMKNIVVSWSMNPQQIIDLEEHGTASLDERLKAMAMVQEKGYKIGIHFDPVIITENWKGLYSGLISDISKVVDPERIAWWSLGALRFPEELKEHIFKYEDSGLFTGELIKGYDGKYRYFKPLRKELFTFVRDEIYKKVSPDAPLYLCMEDNE
ncbi:MAG: radical SAM protein, partial [Acidobacteriota bacterium]